MQELLNEQVELWDRQIGRDSHDEMLREFGILPYRGCISGEKGERRMGDLNQITKTYFIELVCFLWYILQLAGDTNNLF